MSRIEKRRYHELPKENIDECDDLNYKDYADIPIKKINKISEPLKEKISCSSSTETNAQHNPLLRLELSKEVANVFFFIFFYQTNNLKIKPKKALNSKIRVKATNACEWHDKIEIKKVFH